MEHAVRQSTVMGKTNVTFGLGERGTDGGGGDFVRSGVRVFGFGQDQFGWMHPRSPKTRDRGHPLLSSRQVWDYCKRSLVVVEVVMRVPERAPVKATITFPPVS